MVCFFMVYGFVVVQEFYKDLIHYCSSELHSLDLL